MSTEAEEMSEGATGLSEGRAFQTARRPVHSLWARGCPASVFEERHEDQCVQQGTEVTAGGAEMRGKRIEKT